MSDAGGGMADDDVFQHEPEARPSYAEAVAFFGHLAYGVPSLRDALAQHLLETQGEMLPHLFMEDVLEWLLGAVETSHDEARRALDILDMGYQHGSEAFRSLVVVSLLEAMPGFDGADTDPTGRGAQLRASLGRHLRDVLAELERHRRGGATPRG